VLRECDPRKTGRSSKVLLAKVTAMDTAAGEGVGSLVAWGV
jgi:hypothetical protein